MNSHRRLFIALVVSTPCLALFAQDQEAEWISLFDGETLNGWTPTAKSQHSRASGNKTGGHWRVEDGAIVGSHDTPNNGGLLLTDEVFGDVEVSLEMNNDFGPDSGLFLRCTEDGRGYQCLIDYHQGGTLGGILGERIWKRRGVRNFTFGDTPEVITLNENAQPCPVAGAVGDVLETRSVERDPRPHHCRSSNNHHLGERSANPDPHRAEVRAPRQRPHRSASPRRRNRCQRRGALSKYPHQEAMRLLYPTTAGSIPASLDYHFQTPRRRPLKFAFQLP